MPFFQSSNKTTRKSHKMGKNEYKKASESE
jgi:hypothetical protein